MLQNLLGFFRCALWRTARLPRSSPNDDVQLLSRLPCRYPSVEESGEHSSRYEKKRAELLFWVTDTHTFDDLVAGEEAPEAAKIVGECSQIHVAANNIDEIIEFWKRFLL